MDWNWFFSSVAQSAAAIVGILAAFIITKILNSQTEYNHNLNEIINLKNESEKLVDKARIRNFQWYNECVRKTRLQDIKDLLEKSKDIGEIKEPGYYYNQYNFSEFDSKSAILEEIKKVIDDYKDELSRPKPFISMPNIKMPFILPWVEINKEREAIYSLFPDITHNVRKISVFINNIKTNPQSSNAINWSIIALIILFYVGVIYPLSFLPLEISKDIHLSFSAFFSILFSIKGVILCPISIIFTVILAYFFRINSRLKYNDAVIKKLEEYTKIENYSEWFKEIAAKTSRRTSDGEAIPNSDLTWT